jgi:hypothetical protein
MGVDIISGISKASNIFVPLFVDRKESAEHIVPVEQQIIYLQCIYGQPLEIKSITNDTHINKGLWDIAEKIAFIKEPNYQIAA